MEGYLECQTCEKELPEPKTFDEIFDLIDILFDFLKPDYIESLPSVFFGIELVDDV